MWSNKLNKALENVMREVVVECSMRHNFDAEEMMSYLCVGRVGMNKSKKCVGVGVVISCSFPIPYSGSVKENCCKALCKNQGLYTQCETIVEEELDFCNKCDTEIKKSESVKPVYGRIEDRLAVGIMEYRDPSGKCPTPFIKIMKKLKISQEEVMEEAGRLNIIIDEIHFREEEVVAKKEKGRPKKPKRKIELADNSIDLFAALVAKANEEEEDEEDEEEKVLMVESILDKVLDKVSIISENNEKEAEKQAEKLAKEAEKQKKEAEKLAKEAAKEAEKLAKEAAKEAEKLSKETEKEAAKEAAKEAEKLAKEAAKEAAKETEKQKKEAEKLAKEAEKLAKEAEKQAEKLAKEAAKLSKKESAKKIIILILYHSHK